MDAVNAFNLELFSMIDMKPPISRAKMMSVTKSAIKAIKLYKHVVQIVEKFIKKCKPELKVPGLYVMDSIVRQSRHQFGVDKDVYGPRFQKNFTPTFQNLYLCPHDDKSKIIRVLNLWQKNSVFEMNVVQPLLDMATGSFHQAQPQAATQLLTTSASIAAALPQLPPQLQNPEALAAVAQLFQSGQGHELQKLLQNFQMGQQMPPAASNIVVTHPQVNQDPLNTHLPVFDPPPTQPLEQNNLLAKKLLDRFDYDDEPEEVKKDEISSVGQGNPYGQFPGTVPTAVEHQFQGHIIPGLAGAPQTAGVGYSSLNEGYAQNQGNSREREDPSGRREGRQRGSGHARRSRSRSGSR
uniref:CID domain-containing protein n=1 Tax=Esox lucius TaxID=8010 RepID=A0AAY5KIF2_ESOLU